MVIQNPDGSITLESGDPDFKSITDLGVSSPTNFILDPDPNKPLTQFVLETFNIPFQVNSSTGRVMGSAMPGFDIRNQDPTTIIKLSLAAELLTSPFPNSTELVGVGEFVEMELDEFGIGRFYIVGGDQALNLDIRYCVPTTRFTNPADLVIIRGYDPPPERQLRTTFDGLKNAEIMTYEECAAGSCDEQAVGKFASISYDDPLLDQVYLDDIVNSYELNAFESLIGYVIDLDLPDGTDQDDPGFKGVKITFSDTTKEYITVSASLMNAFISAGNTNPTNGLIKSFSPGNSFGSSSGASGSANFGNAINGNGTILTVSVVDPRSGKCSTEVTSVAGSKIIIPASRFTRTNKYGRPESDFAQVQDVVFTGRKIVSISSLTGSFLTAFVKPLKELISLQQGKNWTWTVKSNGDVELELFSLLEDAFAATVCELYSNPPSSPVSLVRRSTSSPNTNEVTGPDAFKGFICNIGDRLGYLALNDRLCIVVERKRPSIDIFDPSGNAIGIASSFRNLVNADPTSKVTQNGVEVFGVRREFGIRYTPIVIVDVPAPVTYAATGQLFSIDAKTGAPTAGTFSPLAAEGIIDQTAGIKDTDPSTVQDFSESPMQILQDNTNGATIDLTLTFCTDIECLDIAKNLLSLQSQVVTQQSIILGPSSEPKLGQILADGSIINEINYSYSDSSQYLITVTAGPKYLTAGSFNDSQYQLQIEDVTREGVVLQDKGNGAEYVILINGFGEITALSTILDQITVGDRVSVRLYNVPTERL